MHGARRRRAGAAGGGAGLGWRRCVDSGAQVAQARRGRGAGAALQRAGGGRAGQRRRRGGVVRERRLSGGVRARSSGGAGATVREEDENCCVKLTRGARGRVKRKQNERARQP